jgi:hypothetical protein
MHTHGEVKCDRCPNTTFRNELILRMHNYRHHGESSAIQKSKHCDQCSMILSTKEDLEAHIQESHPGEAICKYCRWKSPCGSLNSLETHIWRFHGKGKVSDNEEPPKCTQCSKVFQSKARFAQHMEYVYLREEVTCDLCPNKTFRNKTSLSRHQYYTHGKGNEVQRLRYRKKKKCFILLRPV